MVSERSKTNFARFPRQNQQIYDWHHFYNIRFFVICSSFFFIFTSWILAVPSRVYNQKCIKSTEKVSVYSQGEQEKKILIKWGHMCDENVLWWRRRAQNFFSWFSQYFKSNLYRVSTWKITTVTTTFHSHRVCWSKLLHKV